MEILKAILAIIVNFILYLSFGSLICVRKDKRWSLPLTIVTGFFLYYGLFAVCCLPIMITYRPLSVLSKTWAIVVLLCFIVSTIFSIKSWQMKAMSIAKEIKKNKIFYIAVGAIVILQVVLVASTYNFTLDAAYYVANVSTSVDTNMINVYDPFTGAWQDHFELRYVFATYSIQDAVVCQLANIPALIQTKLVMSSCVMILANLLYIWAVGFLIKENKKQGLIMYVLITFVNLTFITLYTSSNFLMTRTYEGKAIVGNVAIVAVFAMYMYMVRDGIDNRKLAMLFAICLGTATISSTANMVIPAQLCVLFIPYVIRHKEYRSIIKFAICMLPEVVMMLVYVFYVKGYFAIYTYPR